MAEWDGPDYLNIVKHGYTASIQANFFPVYPLVVRAVQFVVRSPLDSALLVSWVSMVLAAYFYLKIIKLRYKMSDNVEATRAALFFLLFPTGVFLFGVYTEGLFAFLSLAALYLAYQKKWLPAALLVFLATATHITGIFVLLLIAAVLIEQRVDIKKVVAGFIIGCLGIGSYMVYLQVHFHNALAFVTSQRSHGWLHYGHGNQLLAHLMSRNIIFVILLVIAVIYWWNKQKSYSFYSFLFLCIMLLGGLGAFGRYTLMAFPIPFMLYDYFRDKKFGYVAMVALSAAMWTYFLLQYAAGYSGG